jgi:hypothetical protein
LKLLAENNSNSLARSGRARRARAGFTFAEILAAMLFVTLVLPAAVYGVRMASDAGTVALRKITAAQLGEAMLSDLAVTDEWRNGTPSGSFPEPWENYDWTVTSEGWSEAGMTELLMEVKFIVRQREIYVYLTTLVPETAETEGTQL